MQRQKQLSFSSLFWLNLFVKIGKLLFIIAAYLCSSTYHDGSMVDFFAALSGLGEFIYPYEAWISGAESA